MSLRFFAAVAHPREPRVLLLHRDDAWALPEFACDDLNAGSIEAINRAVSERAGGRVYMLRYLLRGDGDAGRPWLFAFEATDSIGRLPDGGRWADRRDLERAGLIEPVGSGGEPSHR